MNGKGYFVVHEWMITELGLKGTDLFVYAIIYGFTQIEGQEFFGTGRCLSELTGADARSIQRSLDSLVENGFLKKSVRVTPDNGAEMVAYRAVPDTRSKGTPAVPSVHNRNAADSGNTRRFKKPTIAELTEYISRNGYNVNAVQFYDFYESKGWKVGRSPMKDWKAAVRTWSRNGKQHSAPQIQKAAPRFFDEED